MGTAPPSHPRLRRSATGGSLLAALVAAVVGSVAGCSGTTTATPVIGSTTSPTVTSSTTLSSSASVAEQPLELTPSATSPTPSAPAGPSVEPPPSSPSASGPAADCTGPHGIGGATATLVATQGELTCDEMTVAWRGFQDEFPDVSPAIVTTSAGWTCAWVDGPGPRPDAVDGDEGGAGCIREGKSFGPLAGQGSGPGSNGGATGDDCTMPGYNGSTLRIEDSTVSCGEARRIWDLPTLESFGKRVSKGEGWECAYGGAGDGWVSGCSNGSTGDQFAVIPIDGESSGGGAGSGSSDGSGATPGSPGALTTPLTNLGCDGTGIVVLRSAITPGAYQQDIDDALAANPGASVLRTDESCSSLAQATAAGDPIYAVYLATGSSDRGTVCAAVDRAGGDAYGKWLDAGLSPDESRIDC